MAADDDDEVAIEGTPEPASEGARVVHDDDDGPDEFERQGGPVSGEVVQVGRTISPKTRELLAAAAAKLKAQRTSDDEGEGDFGEYDEGFTPSLDAAAANDAAKAAPPPVPGQQAAPPAGPAPAPSLDPSVLEARKAYEAKLAEMDQREQALSARERSSDEVAQRELYLERPVEAIVAKVRAWSGAQTDDELADEIADLITELSGQVHKVPVPPEIKSRLDSKRALRTVKAAKASFAEREAQIAHAAEEAAQKEQTARVIQSLGKELARPEVISKYRFVTAEDNAAELIWDVVKTAHEKSGEALTWEQAAQRADDYLRQQASAWFDKRKHLLNASSQGPSGNGTKESAPGDHQGHRRSRAPEAPHPAKGPEATQTKGVSLGARNWNEDHRAQTKRKMREVFRRAASEE